MDKNVTIEKEREIAASLETVWHVLTDTGFIKQWLGVTLQTDWSVGSPMSFTFTWDGNSFEDKGHIVALEKQQTFSFEYWSSFSNTADSPENYSLITISLYGDNELTRLRLQHSRFSTQTMYEHSDKNWEETLDTIKKLAE